MSRENLPDRSLFNAFEVLAVDLATLLPNEKREEPLNRLIEVARKVSTKTLRLEHALNIRQKLEKKCLSNLSADQDALKSILEEYESSITNVPIDLETYENFKSFQKQIEPLMKDIESAEDDEVQLSAEENVIDPISKLRMVEPVKNKVCGHSYEKSNIENLLKQNNKTKCPVAGCVNKGYVNLTDLVTDIKLKVYLQKNVS